MPCASALSAESARFNGVRAASLPRGESIAGADAAHSVHVDSRSTARLCCGCHCAKRGADWRRSVQGAAAVSSNRRAVGRDRVASRVAALSARAHNITRATVARERRKATCHTADYIEMTRVRAATRVRSAHRARLTFRLAALTGWTAAGAAAAAGRARAALWRGAARIGIAALESFVQALRGRDAHARAARSAAANVVSAARRRARSAAVSALPLPAGRTSRRWRALAARSDELCPQREKRDPKRNPLFFLRCCATIARASSVLPLFSPLIRAPPNARFESM